MNDEFRVKIYGAGSIGNHLAHASRQLGWQVVVCDVNEAALQRMKNEIYPPRYGQWDSEIGLFNSKDAPVGGFDLIFIGTPPESHLSLALDALGESPKAILVEKPLCPPSLELAQAFYERAQASNTKVFAGYDHVVGHAVLKVEETIKSGALGDIQTIDVEFREHWGGIFRAHPWLNGPEDTYLGFWQRGGGASGEHSHAVNLWQHFAHCAGAGRVVELDAMLTYVRQGKTVYDSLCLLNLRTESGLAGRVAQDVVTNPPRKRARIQGSRAAVEWVNGYSPEGDAVIVLRPGVPDEVEITHKKRPDDFIWELEHIRDQLAGSAVASGIRLERGLDTMLVVAAAHLSERERCRISINYDRGYALNALNAAHTAQPR